MSPYFFNIFVMGNIIKLFIWFLIFMLLLEWATARMSAANTVEAVMGIFAIVSFILVSWISRCFTRIHIKITKVKKEEK